MLDKHEVKKEHLLDSESKANSLLAYLSTHYPETLSEGRLNLEALSRLLGLEISERGYELNFTGKPLATALYGRKSTKELKLESHFHPSCHAEGGRSVSEESQTAESTPSLRGEAKAFHNTESKPVIASDSKAFHNAESKKAESKRDSNPLDSSKTESTQIDCHALPSDKARNDNGADSESTSAITSKNPSKHSPRHCETTTEVSETTDSKPTPSLRGEAKAIHNTESKPVIASDSEAIHNTKSQAESSRDISHSLNMTKGADSMDYHEATASRNDNGADSKAATPYPHTIIKGDNLDALKLLKSAYTEKIKMIYIDPPYNTHNENFIYNDSKREDFTQILREVGLLSTNEEGEEVESESLQFFRNITGSRSHSGWLAFMLPRLKLARDLLRDDGVIFISIDDNEQANLKLLCDEIFGEENFVAQIVRETRRGGGFGKADFGITHDYILIYAKERESLQLNKIQKTEKEIKKYFNKNDDKGAYHSRDLRQPANQEGYREKRPFMFYPFLHKNKQVLLISKDEFLKIYSKQTGFDDIFLNDIKQQYIDKGFDFVLPMVNGKFGRWSCGFDAAQQLVQQGNLLYKDGKIYQKERFGSDSAKKVITSLCLENECNNGSATSELGEILGDDIFNDPKPTKLLEILLKIATTSPLQCGGGGEYAA